jgi:PKHD-type hydroxylase
MLKHTYWLWDKVLSKEFCNLVINETDWTKQEKAVVGSETDEEFLNETKRITDIVWVNNMSPIGCVVSSYICQANIQAGWNYSIDSMELIQIGKYKKHGHYNWHLDCRAPNENNVQRKISISIQLNDPSEYKGGKLEFKCIPDDQQPKMQQGSIVVFPSFVEHRVTPITSGIRYSAVSWMNGQAFK